MLDLVNIVRKTVFGLSLASALSFSSCSSSADKKDTAFTTITENLHEVCTSTYNDKFELSRNLLYCEQVLCNVGTAVDISKPNVGTSLGRYSSECQNPRDWGTRYNWSHIQAAHIRSFGQLGCVDLISIWDNSNLEPHYCSIFTRDLNQAEKLAKAIEVYTD